MLIGQLGREKIDLIRVLKHLMAMLFIIGFISFYSLLLGMPRSFFDYFVYIMDIFLYLYVCYSV